MGMSETDVRIAQGEIAELRWLLEQEMPSQWELAILRKNLPRVLDEVARLGAERDDAREQLRMIALRPELARCCSKA